MCEKVKTVTEKLNELMKKEEFTDANFKVENVSDDTKNIVAGCIGEVYIMEQDNKTKEVRKSNSYPAFNRAPAFDRKSMNFHVFPVCNLVYDVLFKEIHEKRKILNGVFSQELGPEFTLTTLGSRGPFTKYNNWLKKCQKLSSADKEKLGNRSNLYEFINVNYHGRCYYLNFMRFYQEDGKVNCDFKSLQYDCVVSGGSVNATADAKVCDVCYPFSPDDGDCHVNSVGNICYNPHISFYDTPETIFKSFLDFISLCDKLITEKNELIKNEF